MSTHEKEEVKVEVKERKAKFCFYLNIHVKDKKQLMDLAVKDSVPKFMAGFTSALGAAVVSDSMVMEELTGELLKEFPKELLSSGITAEFEQVFTRGTMAVLKCSLYEMEFEKAINSTYGDEGMTHYKNLLDSLRFFDTSEPEIAELLSDMEMDMYKSFPEEIGTEMTAEFEKEGLDVVCECKTEEEEATFLFDYMKEHLKKP